MSLASTGCRQVMMMYDLALSDTSLASTANTNLRRSEIILSDRSLAYTVRIDLLRFDQVQSDMFQRVQTIF